MHAGPETSRPLKLPLQIRERVPIFQFLLLVTVLACANHLFYLVSWANLQGVFNSRDIGLLIIFIMFSVLMFRGRLDLLVNNGFSILIVLYLIYVLLQAAVASIIFEQSILNGLVAIRHQFYYLSFFVFLAVLNTPGKITVFLNAIFITAIILVAIGLINHYVVTIYHHQWAEGHGMRAGVARIYFSGMDIITLGLMWGVSGWFADARFRFGREAGTVFLLFSHVLRQTRARIFGVLITLILVLWMTRRYKALAGLIIIIFLSLPLVGAFMEENVLISSIQLTVDEASDGSGALASRIEAFRIDMEIFLSNPYFGSGVSALRLSEEAHQSSELAELTQLAAKEDLGYSHWIKSYGIPGIIWLISLMLLIYKYVKSVNRIANRAIERFVLAATSYITFVLVSFVTLPHLVRPDEIILFCLMLSILVQCYQVSLRDRKRVPT